MLDYEAKRRPEIADVIDRLGEMTDDEIKAVKVPLPWVTKALLAKCEEIRLAKMVIKSNNGFVDDPIGIVKCWPFMEQWVPLNAAGGQLLVKENDLVFFVNNGCWLGTIWCQVVPTILANCRPVREASKSQYSEILREKLMGTPNFKEPESLRNGLFRIQRH